jgi:hypothetical protein
MRRFVTTTVVLATALIAAAVAWAQFSQVAAVSLTGHRAGQSTGISSDLHSSDPAAPGQQPKAATKVVLTFPAGTTFNLATPLVARCTLSDAQLRAQFGRSCPAKSRIGTGAAVANAAPTVSTVNSRVTAFVGGTRTIILVVKPTLAAFASQIVVLRATVSGSRLTIPVPRVVIGKAPGFPGVKVVLVSLKLHVPALGTGHHALITAGRCDAHRFVVRSRFDYADHSTVTLTSSSACR